uniref:Transposase n=1 Tax=Haemonchus contortus TaxID=6289 RepID=A0A7I4YKN0_HAECO
MKSTTGSPNIFAIALEKAESPQVAKRRSSSKTLELIRQRGIARATGNHQQNVRTCEAMQRSDKGRSEREKRQQLWTKPAEAETWTLRKQDEHAVSVASTALWGRTMLGISLYTQVQKGIRSSEPHQLMKTRDAVDYAKKSKIRWAGHVMRYSDDRWTKAVY